MEEFFKENYLFLTFSVEALAAFTGIILYKKYKNTQVKYFIFFLIYIVICELIARYTLYVKNDGFFSFLDGTRLEKNNWWSTFFWKIGAILFYSFFFKRVILNKTYKNIISIATKTFLLLSIVIIIFNVEDFFVRSLPLISISGALVIFICVTLFFLELLLTDKILTFYKSIYFYIASTILIWWLIITPLIFYDIYFTTADWDFIILKWQIYLFSNFFMYCTFSIALIISNPE